MVMAKPPAASPVLGVTDIAIGGEVASGYGICGVIGPVRPAMPA